MRNPFKALKTVETDAFLVKRIETNLNNLKYMLIPLAISVFYLIRTTLKGSLLLVVMWGITTILVLLLIVQANIIQKLDRIRLDIRNRG